jgi:hypothetical protein
MENNFPVLSGVGKGVYSLCLLIASSIMGQMLKSLLQHLGILLSSDFLVANQISSSQNKNTLLEYSTQIKIAEVILETKNIMHNTQRYYSHQLSLSFK